MKQCVFYLFLSVSMASCAQTNGCIPVVNENGLNTAFFENCNKKAEFYLKEGQYDGTYREWNSKGKLKIKGQYASGKKEGLWRHEYAGIDGRNTSNYVYTEFTYENGELKNVHEYVAYGDSLSPKSGEIFITYGKDTVERSLQFHRNGQLGGESLMVNGLLDGIMRAWDENGRMFQESVINKGFPEKEISYALGYSTVTLYNDHTKLKSSLKQYDLSGKLLYEEHYDKKGKVVRKKGVKQTGTN